MKAKGMILATALAALLVVGLMALLRPGFRHLREDGDGVADLQPPAAAPSAAIEVPPSVPEPEAASSTAVKRVTAVSGKVFLDGTSTPAARARVAAIPDGERRHELVATAGDDGAYVLTGLRPGKHRLWAWREDWTTRSPFSDDHEVDVREGEATEGRDLSLVLGVVVEGRVVEEGARRPIPGAAVQFEGLQFAAADGEGRFRLEGVAKGLIRISARAPGRAVGRLQLDAVHGETPSVTIELAPGGIVEGTVTDSAGAPAADVDVTAQSGLTGGGCKTDAGGRYRIEGIALMARDIEVAASLGGRFTAHAAITGFPPGEDRMLLDLQLEEGSVLIYRGRVLDPAGRPVDGATIHVEGSRTFPASPVDAEGRFAIEGATERTYSLSARKQGFAPASVILRHLPPDRREDIELVLKPGHFVEGVVVDARGPVKDATVHVDLVNRAGPTPSTRTDAAGRFRLEDLPEEIESLRASKKGYSDSGRNPVKPDQRDIRIVLEEAGQIEGIVADKTTGAPVHPFVVKVSSAEGDYREKNQAKGYRGGLLSSLGDEGLPFDFPDGGFQIRHGLAPGMFYRLLIIAPGYGEAVLDGVEARPRSASPEPIRVELERGSELRGRITAAIAGELLAGVKVSHVADRRGAGQQLWRDSRRGAGTAVRVSFTDAEGGFVISGLPKTPGVLLLEKPGYARTAVFGAGPSPRVQIFELQPEAIVEGTCRSAAGEPLSGPGIEVLVEEMPFPGAETDAGGVYRIGGLPAGAVWVKMRHQGSLEKTRTATLAPGEKTVLDFTQKGGAIAGRVTEGGRPAPEVGVQVRNLANTEERGFASVDEEGRFHAGGLDPGSYELRVHRGRSIVDGITRTVEVGDGEVACEISLTPAGRLGGRVLDRLSGEPVRGARVFLFKHYPDFMAGGGFKFPGSDWAPLGGGQTEGDEARFRLEVMEAGSYLISAGWGDEKALQGWLGPLHLETGASMEDLSLHVGGPGSLSVTVRDAGTGTPVDGCGIMLRPAAGYLVTLFAKTDGSGSTLIENAPAGRYRLEAQSLNHSSHFAEVEIGETPLAREISLSAASWIAVDLGGTAKPSRIYSVKATVIAGGDPAWLWTDLDGRSLLMGSTAPHGPRQRSLAAREIKVRLKTRAGRYTIRFEVATPHVNSPVVFTQDLEVDVPEGGEAPVALTLPNDK